MAQPFLASRNPEQDLFNLKGDILCVFLYFKYSWCKYLLYQLWDDR